MSRQLKYTSIHLFSFLIVFTLLSCSEKGLSKSSENQTQEGAPVSSPPKALLYELRLNNESRGYLLGTVHLYPSNEYVLSDTVKSYVPICDKVFCELDFTQVPNPLEFAKFASMDGDTLLSDLIDSDDFERLDQRFQENLGVPLLVFNSWKPSLLGLFLNMDQSSLEMDLVSMEMNLMEWKGSASTGGLETMEEQVALFDRFSYQKQAQDLLKLLDSKETPQEFTELLSAYVDLDLEALEELTLSDEYIDENQDVLLKFRNEKWVLKMDSICAKETAFFAVGAAHLVGENGLLQLLSESAYELCPISIPILEKK
jgi:uncharacterized protein YbaP (TraB family)